MGVPRDHGPPRVPRDPWSARRLRNRLLPHGSQGNDDETLRARLQPCRASGAAARCLGGLDIGEVERAARLLSPRRLRRVPLRGARSSHLRSFSVLCRRRALFFENVRGLLEVASAHGLGLRGSGSPVLARFGSFRNQQSLDRVSFS